MSILIKGMEMPKSCSDCPCIDLDNDEYECAVCSISKKPIPWKWANSHGIDVIYLRPTACPLIEVPPHGRLIDADAILGKINAIISAHPDEAFLYEQDAVIVRDWLRSEPTVIEREKT